ncbi:hypothetical protein NCS52_01367900 [Fusarium sp. LHS14.1]|nr:hypothetical protein NCS52_01588900 [Fusarium sp. LHS14.1]KAI8710279.1 hypothetical protein NCS52_01589300 [Fusarium sp. LHS14.1]KAI8712691.1 hypothetical protein NCS52_01367900 [Fusarium sp. LHS14.1]
MEDPRDYCDVYDEQSEDVVCWGTDSDDMEMGESLVPCTTLSDEEPEVVERVGLRATHVEKRKRERGILEGSDEDTEEGEVDGERKWRCKRKRSGPKGHRVVQRVDVLLQICDRCGAYELWEEHFLREKKKQQSWISFSGRQITVDRLNNMGRSMELLTGIIEVIRIEECQDDDHFMKEYRVPVMVDNDMLL